MTAKGGTGRKPGEKDPMKEPGAGNGGPMKPGDEVGKGENPVGGKPGEDEKRRAELGRLAEVYKDTWGHLPETLRQEMDLYYREQFMPRYSDLLKQYYASLAERKGRTRE
jgi:hypothetical protein